MVPIRWEEGVIRDDGPISVVVEEEEEEEGSGSGGSGIEFTIRLAFFIISFMYSRRLSAEECGISFHAVGARAWRASWRVVVIGREEMDG